MPLPGGSADKLGNSYEAKWLVKQMIKLLDGGVTSLTMEPVGDDGDKIEFHYVTPHGEEVAHQVKRQNAGKGVWTLGELNQRGIIEGIRKHVIRRNRRYVFVSTDSVDSIKELCERAKQAGGFKSFQKDFLTTQNYQTQFKNLSASLNVKEEVAFDVLTRIEFRIVDELTLEEANLAQIDHLFDGDSKLIHGQLFQFGFDSVHKTITEKSLAQHILDCGITWSDIGRDGNLLASFNDYISEYKASYQFDLDGKGTIVEREQTRQIVSLLSKDEERKRVIFLTGRAGCGKSGVIGQVIEHCQNNNVMVLPLRFDRLEPTQSIKDIGDQIIGRKVPPDDLLMTLAQNNRAVMIIEQLDAISTVSGRNPEFFETVDKMMRHADIHKYLTVIVVCRNYDLDNDARFRRLKAELDNQSEKIDVGKLTVEEVKDALKRLDFDSAALAEAEIDLLQLPIHLSMFATMMGDAKHRPFRTAKDLFDQYWTFIETYTRPHLGDPNNMAEILHYAAQSMSETGRLSVPKGRFRKWQADLAKLLSANILKEYQRQVGFFHESFFDYIFARFFVEDGESLCDFVKSGEQGLFIRATVRQVLTFLRDEDINEYFCQLRLLLDDNDIRFHIKKLVLSFIGQVDDPQDEEWRILQGLFNDSDCLLHTDTKLILRYSSAWFSFLFDRKIIHKWLEEEIDKPFALGVCYSNVSSNSEYVAELLTPLFGRSVEQDLQLASLIRFAGREKVPPRIVQMVEYVIDQYTVINDDSKKLFVTLLEATGYRDHKLYCYILGRYLCSLQTLPVDTLNQYEIGKYLVFKDHHVKEAAEAEPLAYQRQLLDPVLLTMNHFARPSARTGRLKVDFVWGHFYKEQRRPSGALLLLKLLVKAIKHAVTTDKSYLYVLYKRLVTIDIETVHWMLLEILGEASAQMAGDYLLEHWKKSGMWTSHKGQWLVCNVLSSIASQLPRSTVKELETLILEHWEQWNEHKYYGENRRRCAYWYVNEHGLAQFKYLRAIGSANLSTFAKKRFLELSRKSKTLEWDVDAKPYGVRTRVVRSPIEQSTTEKMSDAQWVKAINRYNSEEERDRSPDHVILGGASELAVCLRKLTKNDPARFSRFLFMMPDDAHHAYFDQIALGLDDADVILEDAEAIVQRLIHCCSNESGRWISKIIAKNIDDSCQPTVLIEYLLDLALNNEDPEEEVWNVKSEGSVQHYGGDPRFHGINTVRGAAALAVSSVLWKGEVCFEILRPAIEKMAEDVSIAVRTCVVDICLGMLSYDRHAAIQVFLKLADTDDVLLCGYEAYEFLWYTCDEEYEAIEPLLRLMVTSPIDDVRENAGKIVAGAHLYGTVDQELLALVTDGDQCLRKGAAVVYAENVWNEKNQRVCVIQLTVFFDDDCEDVRNAASNWNRHHDDELSMTSQMVHLLEIYCGSKAIMDDIDYNLGILIDDVQLSPQMLFTVVDKFVTHKDNIEPDSSNGHLISELIMRVYQQADNDSALRIQCLDRFDKLLACEMFESDSALTQYER